MVLGQRGGRFGGVGQGVLVCFQEVFDLFEARQPGLVGALTGGVEAGGGVVFAELQQAQADAIGLLRVGAAFELLAHPGLHVRPQLCGPAFEAFGRPLLLCPVALGHVGRVGGEAVAVPARMGGDAALLDVDVSAGVKLPTCADLKFPSLWMVAGHYDLPNFTPLRMLSVWFQPTEVAEVITWERLFMLHELHAQGVSISAIARQTGLDRKTVRRHLAAGIQPPVYGRMNRMML